MSGLGECARSTGVTARVLLELREDGHVLLVICELDVLTAPMLAHRVHVSHRGRLVDVDLSGVVFIDAAGLGVLCRLTEMWPSLRLRRPSACVRSVAVLAGLEQMFDDA